MRAIHICIEVIPTRPLSRIPEHTGSLYRMKQLPSNIKQPRTVKFTFLCYLSVVNHFVVLRYRVPFTFMMSVVKNVTYIDKLRNLTIELTGWLYFEFMHLVLSGLRVE
jgi:hypothetical protein